jgi:hypothetical protein
MRRARMFVRVIRAIQIANVFFAGLASVGFFLPWITTGPCSWCGATEPTITLTGWTIAATYVGVFDITMVHFWAMVALSLATVVAATLTFWRRRWNTIELFLVPGAAMVWYSLELGLVIGSGGTETQYAVGGILQFFCFIACFIVSAIVFSTRSRLSAATTASTSAAR